MITTLFFIQLIAFQMWYVTSGQVKQSAPPVYLTSVLRNRQTCWMIGAGLTLVSVALFVIRLGWMSGICAGVVGLMGAGCLVVVLNPFRYIDEKTAAMVYAVFLALELLIS